MKKTFFTIILVIAAGVIFCLSACHRETNISDTTDGTVAQDENVAAAVEPRLYIPREKLEILFGKGFVPISNRFVNLDSDADEEYLIAFKKKNSAYINVFIFDIIQNDVIRKKFSVETTIVDSDNLLIQTQNLFVQNDLYLIIEGKSAENKQTVYFITYENEQYNVVDIFTGDYSVFINYEEIENDKGKYDILSDVTVINNSFTSTNVNIKRKEVYKWNYTNKTFYKAHTEEIRSETGSVSSLIYGSEDKYFGYISGFWYPSEYQSLIEKDKLRANEIDYKSIQFINFNHEQKQISLKFGDYIENYRILRISKLWGQKPGVRFRITEAENKHNNDYPKSMDVYLVTPTSLRVSGPHKYASNTYIRLPKPFPEYVYDRDTEIANKEHAGIRTFLKGGFVDTYSGIKLDFISETRMAVIIDDVRAECSYKINHNDNLTLISLVGLPAGMLTHSNFIVTIDAKNASLSLMPIKLSINGFKMDNIKSLNFVKEM